MRRLIHWFVGECVWAALDAASRFDISIEKHSEYLWSIRINY